MNKLAKAYKSKWFPVILFGVYFCVPYLIYIGLYLNNIIPVSGDAIGFFTVRLFSNESILNGELPLWNSLLENGIPWAGDFYGVFYPLHLLLGIFSLKEFIYLFYAFHLALGSVFFYLYLKETGIRQSTAVAVSLIYLCSIHLGGLRKSHMILIIAMVFLPVAMYWAEKFINELKWKYLGYAALFMAACMFSGAHIQQIVYTNLAVGFYLVVRLLLHKVSIKRIFTSLGGWVLTYIGLVALQLLPAIEILRYYSRIGSEKISYELFTSYSIHPIKLILMLFPHIFGDDLYQPMGLVNSSEMDIEIFLGTIVVIFMVYGVIHLWRNSKVRVYLVFILAAVMVAACGHIPLIGKILYHIPLINGFRVPSRTLFLFIFFCYCLFARALDFIIGNLECDREAETKRLCRYLRVWLLAAGALFFCILFTEVFAFPGNSELLLQNIHSLTVIFSNVIISSALFLLIIYLYGKAEFKRLSSNGSGLILLLLVTAVVLLETREFTAVTQGTPEDSVFLQDSILYKIKADGDKGGVLLAQPQITGTYESPVSFSRNLEADVPVLNAYVSLNNPRLFKLLSYNTSQKPGYNFSGLYTGFEDVYNNLLLDNDILSMLGVRYIMDPMNYIERNKGSIVKEFLDDKTIFAVENTTIPASGGNMYVYSQEVELEEYTYYKIRLKINSETTERVYVDFYGDNYDNPAQEYHFTVNGGEAEYEILLNSGDCKELDSAQFRLVCNPTGQILIEKAEMTSQQVTWDEGVYTLFAGGDSKVYENTNARETIYPAEQVFSVKTAEDIYNNKREYRLDRDSYIENINEESLQCAQTVVDNIKSSNHATSARVKSDGATFVNFAQNYYPGWTVYVDGEKRKNYLVNGLIQGTFVDAGTHMIEFKFEPVSVYAGGVISLLTLAALGIYLALPHIRKKDTLRRQFGKGKEGTEK